MSINYKSIIEFIKNNDDGVRKYTKKDIADFKQKQIDEQAKYVRDPNVKCMVDNVFNYTNLKEKPVKVIPEIKYVDLHLYENSKLLSIDEIFALCKNIEVTSENTEKVIEVINKYNFSVCDVLQSFDLGENKTVTFVVGKNNYLFDLILEKSMFSYHKIRYDMNSPLIRPYVLNIKNMYNKNNKSYIRKVDCSILFEDHPYTYPANLKLQNILLYMETPNVIDYLYNRFGVIEKFANKLKSMDESWNVQLIGNPLSTNYTETELFNFNIDTISCRIIARIDDTDIEIIPSLLHMNGYDDHRASTEYQLVIRPTYESIIEITDGNITIFEEWYKKLISECVPDFSPIMVKLNMDDFTEFLKETHEYIRLIRKNYGFFENGKYYNDYDFYDIGDKLVKEGIIYDYIDYIMLYGDVNFGNIDMAPKIEFGGTCTYMNNNIDNFTSNFKIKVNRVIINVALTYDIDKDPNNCYLNMSAEKNKSIYSNINDIIVGPKYELIAKYSTIENEIRNLITEITLLQ